MIARLSVGLMIAFAMTASAVADGHRMMAPKDAMVYIISPSDGATVSSPVKVVFGLKGMGVAPAGVEKKDTGHHHLLIDTTLEDYNASIPSDEQNRHFGGGQTETSVELSPGKHTLQLILGDHNHIPHDTPVQSKPITITVK